ncbi:sigma factor [Chitinophaga lutea]|uniref:sigma factor n=1 Tax=Chitinophaga lutea TaxID=2488634 RepID=UPI001C7087C8
MQKTRYHSAAEGAEGDVIAQLRPLLTTYAYNITGVLEEARDLVQDAYVRFMQTDTKRTSSARSSTCRSTATPNVKKQVIPASGCRNPSIPPARTAGCWARTCCAIR